MSWKPLTGWTRARLLGAGCALGLLATAAAPPVPTATEASVRNKLILFVLMNCKIRAENTGVSTNGVSLRGFQLVDAYADSLTVVQDTARNKFSGCLENEGNAYVINKISTHHPHYGTIGFLDRYLQAIWGVGAMNEQFVSRFRNEFGINPLNPSIATANGSKWLQWSGPAVQLVFNKYYAKPSGTFHQLRSELLAFN